MVFLIGLDSIDDTLIKIIQCFNFLGFDNYIKINQQELFEGNLRVELGKETYLVFDNSNRIRINQENATVFLWKWDMNYAKHVIHKDSTSTELQEQLINEGRAICLNFLSLFEPLNKITPLFEFSLTKFHQLIIANSVGLKIPETQLLSSKEDLIQNTDKKDYITKCFGSYLINAEKNRKFLNYTISITKDVIDKLPTLFFPSVIQPKIHKIYEVRVLYFYGEFFSISYFVNEDSKNTIDIRETVNTNKTVNIPIELPSVLKKKIKSLMKKLKLNYGAIDLIKTLDNHYYFLEVNPSGQFESTAKLLGIDFHMKIAKKLIELAQCE